MTKAMPSRRKIMRVGLTSTVLAGVAASFTAADTAHAAAVRGGSASDAIAAKEAISDKIYTYPRGLDRLDRELLMSIAHPDGTASFGKLAFNKWADFVDWLITAHTKMIAHNHHVTNILIQVQEDAAVSETGVNATLLSEDEKGMCTERWMSARYLDRWAVRDSKWGITNRQMLVDYRRVTTFPTTDLGSRYIPSKRMGREDPSYKLFGA